jgi:isoamylase
LPGVGYPLEATCDEPDHSNYADTTGTGTRLNVRHPHALRLIMDSLGYGVLEMRVDGFRLDLAAARYFRRGERRA